MTDGIPRRHDAKRWEVTGSVLSPLLKTVRRHYFALILIILVLLYFGMFYCLIKSYTISYITEDEHLLKPVVLLYFSSNKTINDILYVGFFPCVQAIVLARDDTAFAHAGESFRGVHEIELGEAPEDMVYSRWTIARPVAAVVWLGALVLFIILYPKRLIRKRLRVGRER